MENITKNDLENSARLFAKNYTLDYIKRIIMEAQSALHDLAFDQFDYDWKSGKSYHEQYTEHDKKIRKAWNDSKEAIVNAYDDLTEIKGTLYSADCCEEATDEEIDDYIKIAEEAEKLFNLIDDALYYLDKAESAYKELLDNFEELDYLTR